jgi:hypothetical protein
MSSSASAPQLGRRGLSAIFRAFRVAMGPDSLLLLGEELLEPDPSLGHPAAYLIDMQMIAMFGVARARTEDEFSALLAASGLTPRRVVATASSNSIIGAGPQGSHRSASPRPPS